jgi:hypothetical protein
MKRNIRRERKMRKICKAALGNINKAIHVFLYSALLILFSIVIVSPEAQAKYPDYVIADYSIYNGAVTGQVVSYDKNTGDAIVSISNPKYFWTKIVFTNLFGFSINNDSLYANFGFLGPASATIPWEPGFSTAQYKIHFDKQGVVNIGVDPTINNGPGASILNIAQILLTAAPSVASSISMNQLSDIFDFINDTNEIKDIVNDFYLKHAIIYIYCSTSNLIYAIFSSNNA